MVYVILLAMVAGFLAMRLYAVLGKRTGHEQPLPKPAEDRALPRTPLAPALDVARDGREPAARDVEPRAEAGIRAIAAAEPGFDPAQFLDGARGAYRMVLEAFWKGDRDELTWLVEPQVLATFDAAIADREAAGHVLENRLLGIERAAISDAALDGRVARISVRIDADITAITRDADGALIAGSMSDAVETHDVWTFVRVLRSDDPNWKLAETDEG